MRASGSSLRRTVALVAILLLAGTEARALQAAAARPKLAGRLLADVLRDLQAQGLKIIFSSELVRPEMRVETEPKATTPRKILDEVLTASGLEVRSGPGASLLVVRGRSPRSRSTTETLSKGTIAGTVVDARNGAPLPGVLVVAPGGDRKTVTGTDGTFVLSDLAAEPQPLFVSLVGYGVARPIVDVQSGKTAQVTVPLADGTSTYTEHVTVVGDPFRGTQDAAAPPQILTSAELQALRGVLTDDPFRAVQALPGVANADDRRSEFSVRGSDFRHMGLSIDGLPAKSLLHNVRDYENNGSIGLVNGDLLDRVELTAGAYAQEQPGRTGAWLDLRLREGSRDVVQAHGAVSMTNASLAIEGPLGSARRGSWLISARQSYIQWLIRQLDFTATTFGFTDAETKVVFDVTPRQQIQLTAVAGRSRLDQNEPNGGPSSLRVGTANLGLVALGWRSTIGRSVVLMQRVGVQGDRFRNDSVSGRTVDSTSTELSYQGDLSWTPRPRFTMQLGSQVQRQWQDEFIVRFLQSPSSSLRQTERVDGRAWITAATARVIGTSPQGASIDSGVRVSRATLVGETTVSPWLVGAWPLTPALSLRAGGSLAHQVPEFDQVIGTFGDAQAGAERARNVDLGLEYRLTPATRAQVTVYDRQESGVLRLEDSETRLVDGRLVFAQSLVPSWQPVLRGSSRGVEAFVQRRAAAGLTGWVSYAYGRTRYTDVERHEVFPADFDQRHTVNAYGQVRVSPRTSVNARWRVGSGVPLSGYFDQRSAGMFVGSGRNSVRLPAYARLDLRADHTFNYRSRRLTLFGEVVNVMNRTNYAASRRGFHDDAAVVLATGEVREFRETLFPLLPSIGFRIEF